MSVNLNRDVGPRGRESFDGLDRNDTVYVIQPAGNVRSAMFCEVLSGGEQANVLLYDRDGNPGRRTYVFPPDLLHPDENPEDYR